MRRLVLGVSEKKALLILTLALLFLLLELVFVYGEIVCCRWQRLDGSTWVDVTGTYSCAASAGQECTSDVRCNEEKEYRGKTWVQGSPDTYKYSNSVYGIGCKIFPGSNLAWASTCTSVLSCCDNTNDCVEPDGTCQDHYSARFITTGKDRYSICTWSGSTWRDCDDAVSFCDGAASGASEDCAIRIGTCTNNNCWITAGEAGVGEYTDQTTAKCCGDDSAEHFITAGVGPTKCCDTATDCVDSTGACRGGTELCNADGTSNGIDEDCDGTKDEGCCPCTPWRNLDPGCAIGSCKEYNQMKQTRQCTPSSSACPENRCVTDICTDWVKIKCCSNGLANQTRNCEFHCDIENRCFADASCACTPGPCSNQTGVCDGAMQDCIDFVSKECNAIEYLAHNPSYEPVEVTLDDGLDNDCDGKTDEIDCPAGKYPRYRECAPGVCQTDKSDWACADNETDCVFNRINYTDMVRAIANYTQDKITECKNQLSASTCTGNCEWKDTCSLKVNVVFTNNDIKNSLVYHDKVFKDINTNLLGEEYCDPGTWQSDEFKKFSILNGTVYNLDGTTKVEGATVTVLGSNDAGILRYTDDTDANGEYAMTVSGNIIYNIGASKTNYVQQPKKVYALAGATNTTNFNLRYNSLCDPDCTYTDDERCHKECDGDPNGCKFFYDSVEGNSDKAKEICGGTITTSPRSVYTVMQYSQLPELDIVCCEGAPYSPMQAITKVNTTGNIVTIRKPVWYGGKLVNMIITFFD